MSWTTILSLSQLGTNWNPGMASVLGQGSSQGGVIMIRHCLDILINHRRVVKYGLYMRHCTVEVYLMEFKLCVHPNLDAIKKREFSRSNTVGEYF